jgi:hypothetical protein
MKTCAKDYILRGLTNNKQDEVNGKKSIQKVRMICNFFLSSAELSMVTFLFASYMLTTACGTVGLCLVTPPRPSEISEKNWST